MHKKESPMALLLGTIVGNADVDFVESGIVIRCRTGASTYAHDLPKGRRAHLFPAVEMMF